MNDANDSPDTADTADKSDRWTVRGIGAATRRKAADMAAKADVPLGRWLSQLIEQAADKSDMADVPADALGPVLARLERLERAVFVADMSDMGDTEQAVAVTPNAAVTSDMSDKSDTESSAALCRTAADKSDSEMPACGAIAVRTRLSGDAKAERAADIKRRLAAGESKPDIMSALGISLATLNRALAE